MRAVKSVLVMAGGLKRANPTLNEDITLIRALRDSNLPKFLYDDVPLFTSIIQDLFPGVEIPSVDYGMLQIAIERQLCKAKLQPVPTYVAKVIQVALRACLEHAPCRIMVVEAQSGVLCAAFRDYVGAARCDGGWYDSDWEDELPRSTRVSPLAAQTRWRRGQCLL